MYRLTTGQHANRRSRRLLAAAVALWLATMAAGAAEAVEVRVAGTETCERCEAQADFHELLRATGALADYFEIRQGIGIMYTAQHRTRVRKLQAIVKNASAVIHDIERHPSDHELCRYCSEALHTVRKLRHEVLPSQDGVIVLITSEDPDAVRALQEMVSKRNRAPTPPEAPAPPRVGRP